MAWKRLAEIGMRQAGLVTPRCAVDAGLSRAMLINRARREGWDEPFPGVFLLPGLRLDAYRRSLAAGHWSRGRAVVGAGSALALHDLLRPTPSPVELLLPRSDRGLTHPGVRTRWTRNLPPGVITEVDGVGVTDVARSLADHAGELHLTRLRAIAFDATSRKLLRPEDLRRELESRQRFAGRSRYAQLLRDLEGDGSESGFEFDTRDQLIVAGLPPDPDQAEVATRTATRRIDIPYRRWRVGIECLGYAYHASPSALQRDASRANAIAALDEWLILRLTWRMLHEQWEAFLRDLRDSLRRRGAGI